jgi:hypothetical protein
MHDLGAIRAAILDHYNPLLHRSEPFGDVVFLDRPASHLLHVTDLVWIKHILGDFALTDAQRDAWATRINRDQDPDTGLFHYPPGERHIDAHATWQSVAALNILGRRPAHRLACLDPLRTVDGFRAWCHAYDPRTSHHRFFLAALAAASMPVPEAWKAVFRDWYDGRQDRESGFPCCSDCSGCLSPAFLLTNLRAAFAGPPALPDRIVDTVLGFQEEDGNFTESDAPGYMEMDAAWLLHSLGPAVPEHRGEIGEALERLGRFLDGVFADGGRRARLLAQPHAALAVCGTLAVLWRHFGSPEGRRAPFPWAELDYCRAPV